MLYGNLEIALIKNEPIAGIKCFISGYQFDLFYNKLFINTWILLDGSLELELATNIE